MELTLLCNYNKNSENNFYLKPKFITVVKSLHLNSIKYFGLIVSKSTHEWPRVTWSKPRVTTSDYEWPRVGMHQNILLMSWWRHHSIILSNNHYFTANWPFLETLIPGFDISSISDWMGEGLRTDREGEWGLQTSCHPHPLIPVPTTFLKFFFPPFFPPLFCLWRTVKQRAFFGFFTSCAILISRYN